MGLGRSVLLLLAVSVAAATAHTAAADEPPKPNKDRCFDAYEQAQRLRKEYKLTAAREQLVACSASSCPGFVAQDCTKWLAEVEASTPTIVVLARGPEGRAIEDARVTIDGKPFATHLDGRALPIDPGPHDVHCEADGISADQHVVVAEGAKNQQLTITLAPREAPAPPPPPSTGGGRHIPLATWVLGGVAVAGAVSFGAFALAGRSVQSCAPGCTRSQVDELRRDYVIADASWITGLVAAGAALYFALTAPSTDSRTPATTAIRW